MLKSDLTWEEIMAIEDKYPFSAGARPPRTSATLPRRRKHSKALRTTKPKRAARQR